MVKEKNNLKMEEGISVYKDRVASLIKAVSAGLYEREEVVAGTLLAVLAGQSAFLYGPPGTAKSLIARRIAKTFKDAAIFEYLLQRFSTPEEIFGPVSLQQLKEDKFRRQTKGYLPTADFAFLDEIWKSSPAILNTLLTIINERVYRNGEQEEKVPLKGLIVASNETAPPNLGLEALYDRLTVRITVPPVQEREHFQAMLNAAPVGAEIEVDDKIVFDPQEWQAIAKGSAQVSCSEATLNIIHAIRVKIDDYNRDHPEQTVYISDRRWQQIITVLKTAAYLCDRHEVLPVDTLFLKNCLWSLTTHRQALAEMIETAVKDFAADAALATQEWEAEYAELKEDLMQTLFHQENIYQTEEIGGKSCLPLTFKVNDKRQNPTVTRYAPISRRGATKNFWLLTKDGKADNRVRGNFKGGGDILTISIDENVKSYGWENYYDPIGRYTEIGQFPLTVHIKKGVPKPVVSRVKETFMQGCRELIESMTQLIAQGKADFDRQKEINDTPFVAPAERQISRAALEEELAKLENHRLNAEHLLDQVNRHADTA